MRQKKNNNVQLSMVSGGGTDGEKKGGKTVASRRDCDGAGEDGPRVPRIIDFGSWSIWVIGKGVGVGVGHGDGKGRRKGVIIKQSKKGKKSKTDAHGARVMGSNMSELSSYSSPPKTTLPTTTVISSSLPPVAKG